jgi:hypothetical protein
MSLLREIHRENLIAVSGTNFFGPIASAKALAFDTDPLMLNYISAASLFDDARKENAMSTVGKADKSHRVPHSRDLE